MKSTQQTFEYSQREHTTHSSPLGTVNVARFTATLLVGVFENDFLPSHHAFRTRGDTMWTVLQAGTCYTLICSLETRIDNLADRPQTEICKEK